MTPSIKNWARPIHDYENGGILHVRNEINTGKGIETCLFFIFYDSSKVLFSSRIRTCDYGLESRVISTVRSGEHIIGSEKRGIASPSQ